MIATLCLLAIAVPAATAAPLRTVSAPAAVTALALEGRLVAFASGRSSDDCDRIRIWNLKTRAVTALGRSTSCERTSTGTGVASLALAGTRVVWLHYTGGNIREWTLWTASTTKRMPVRLRAVARDVDAVAPIVVGNGESSNDGGMLPYAVDSEVVVLRADGARRFTWSAPRRVVGLSAARGELAVALEGGEVTILDAEGSVRRRESFGSEIEAIRFTGNGLFVLRGAVLELRDGSVRQEWTVSRAAELLDAIGSGAIYERRGSIRSVSTSPFVDRELGRGSFAQAEGTELAVANGRVVSVRRFPPVS